MATHSWLITGGCGFIGTNLIKKLVQNENHHIRVVDNLSVGTLADLESIYPFRKISRNQINTQSSSPYTPHVLIEGDIMDESLAIEVTKGVDVIVHLAANTGVGPSVENPRADCMANVVGTLNYLEAARLNQVKRFIFASSGAPAGEVIPPIHEEIPPHPVSPYGASKLAGEGYCSAYFKTFGLETVALRFGNVYGPGSLHKNSVVAKFIKQALEGKDLEIYGDGTQTRDFIYIEDLIGAIELASFTSEIGGEVFQIATHKETTIGEMVEIMVKMLSEQGIDQIAVKYGQPRLGDVKRNYSDTTKARKMLSWKPHTGLRSGLTKTIAYYLNEAEKLGTKLK